MSPFWKVRVDTGGTFTDAWALTPTGEERRCKVLSDGSLVVKVQHRTEDHWLDLGRELSFSDHTLVGFDAGVAGKVIAARERGRWIKTAENIEADRLTLRSGEEAPVLVARILTGTPLAEKLPEMDFRVATTRGTNALLERKGAPTVLFVTRGFADLPWIRDQRRDLLFSLAQPAAEAICEGVVPVKGRLDATGQVVEHPDEHEVKAAAREWLAKGVKVAAVAILHSWRNPALEETLAGWIRSEGFEQVTTSSSVAPVIRFLPRMETALADAWLSPVMKHFTGQVSKAMTRGEPLMMTSAGGLVPASRYKPKDSLVSGPAGGFVGAAAIANAAGFPKVLTFDMGGTSTDVARIDGAFEYRYEQQIGPARVLAPTLKIETVAAGGGSICQWKLGRLEVGPESAGSDPGPACYGRGGPLTVTDVNLLLGLMKPEGAGIPLDLEPAEAELQKLILAMQADGVTPPSERELLIGLRSIAVEKMANAIRGVSYSEGHDPRDFVLFAFGGAGPQHACAVAENLGMSRVLVPGDAGLLSAWGLDRAKRQEQATQQILLPLGQTSTASIWKELASNALEPLQPIDRTSVGFRYLAELRLLGQDTSIEVEADLFDEDAASLEMKFRQAYSKLYGYDAPSSRAIECAALRVIAEEISREFAGESFGEIEIRGPLTLQDRFSTCILPDGWGLRKGNGGTLLLEKESSSQEQTRVGMDSEIQAALFRSRFEGLATDMGAILRRTALSPNVKERLDYSCALLDSKGRLLVNAPHVPVHLGALGVCVREVASQIEFHPGDVVVTNHPAAGGSHLPDVTVIAAAFDPQGNRIGYVANRAHHAEIGGMAPGSMPANARNLAEEGVVISPIKWLKNGVMDSKLLEDLLRQSPYPSRRPEENLADLEAQAAAVSHGVRVLQSLAEQHGGAVIQKEMSGILDRSAALMQSLLKRHEGLEISRQEELDDGWPIRVSITVQQAKMTVDFSGSGEQHPANLNATPAIVRSVLLYVLRLWLDEDIPLNEGLLDSVNLIIPQGFLNPSFPPDPKECPAVVGGNIETSQRLTDLLLAALDLCAHGQGTMNNFLFGNDSFGYYETIAGGSGAGPNFAGQSGRHCHMTNTAITDAEILEHRFPVRLHRFEFRPNSGGDGEFTGGNGLIREVEFLQPVTVSMLTQRRSTSPQGMHGGENGASGSQVRITLDGTAEVLPGSITYQAAEGERIILSTPGGGGWNAHHS
ncbi:hydantoinase B/oxoprolinase family protein [Luteolibacter pohnpeiensis]|uniref:Hydantoinase B/oxoprolinase family protein n=1 Tax=Luteolibacter pohnpeiensis TaxID=454153 RepID=A0A934S8Z1_9BACT|nr:hydantoinase B/oxoprolinase family protein [Luteolibacter pohnpeiensis]MBK1881559.1 hydantoinase B/oxoprolinase family protein [Luteolibacter pohnpeiensis]